MHLYCLHAEDYESHEVIYVVSTLKLAQKELEEKFCAALTYVARDYAGTLRMQNYDNLFSQLSEEPVYLMKQGLTVLHAEKSAKLWTNRFAGVPEDSLTARLDRALDKIGIKI